MERRTRFRRVRERWTAVAWVRKGGRREVEREVERWVESGVRREGWVVYRTGFRVAGRRWSQYEAWEGQGRRKGEKRTFEDRLGYHLGGDLAQDELGRVGGEEPLNDSLERMAKGLRRGMEGGREDRPRGRRRVGTPSRHARNCHSWPCRSDHRGPGKVLVARWLPRVARGVRAKAKDSRGAPEILGRRSGRRWTQQHINGRDRRRGRQVERPALAAPPRLLPQHARRQATAVSRHPTLGGEDARDPQLDPPAVQRRLDRLPVFLWGRRGLHEGPSRDVRGCVLLEDELESLCATAVGFGGEVGWFGVGEGVDGVVERICGIGREGGWDGGDAGEGREGLVDVGSEFGDRELGEG